MLINKFVNRNTPPDRHYRGSVVLVAAVIAALISSGVAFSLAKLHTATMKTLEVSKVNIEAQQYGLAKAEYLRSTAYDALASQGKQAVVSSDGFKDEVIVSSEEPYNDKLNQKVCTVNVYKDDEKLPRFSYKVSKLSSDSDSNSNVPKGTILPWYGSADNVPNGYAVCNGQNGTPDLRGRFLVGVNGSTYKLGSKGGEEKHKLVNDELPKNSANISGAFLQSIKYDYEYGENDQRKGTWGTTSNFDFYVEFTGTDLDFRQLTYFPSSITSNSFGFKSLASVFSSGNDQPHENRPPYFAVYYIMKL